MIGPLRGRMAHPTQPRRARAGQERKVAAVVHAACPHPQSASQRNPQHCQSMHGRCARKQHNRKSAEAHAVAIIGALAGGEAVKCELCLLGV